MAVKAFSITASYDILIRESLDRALGTGNRDFLLVSSRLRQALRYGGENPHQRGGTSTMTGRAGAYPVQSSYRVRSSPTTISWTLMPLSPPWPSSRSLRPSS